MICIALKDFYYVEWFVLRWIICTTLNDLCSVELFVQYWIICTKLNNLYYVEWFVHRWIIFTTLKNLYKVEWFVQPWMIWSAMDELYNIESFGLRWIIEYRLFNECQVCLFEKVLQDILHYPLSYFFPHLEISRRNVFGPAPEIGHKEMFLITLVETIINVISRYI